MAILIFKDDHPNRGKTLTKPNSETDYTNSVVEN